MAGMDEVLERLMSDPGFQQALAADPARALEGYDLSDDDLEVLSSQFSVDTGGESRVEQRTSKAGMIGLLGSFLGGSGGGAAPRGDADKVAGAEVGARPPEVTGVLPTRPVPPPVLHDAGAKRPPDLWWHHEDGGQGAPTEVPPRAGGGAADPMADAPEKVKSGGTFLEAQATSDEPAGYAIKEQGVKFDGGAAVGVEPEAKVEGENGKRGWYSQAEPVDAEKVAGPVAMAAPNAAAAAVESDPIPGADVKLGKNPGGLLSATPRKGTGPELPADPQPAGPGEQAAGTGNNPIPGVDIIIKKNQGAAIEADAVEAVEGVGKPIPGVEIIIQK